MSVVCNGTTQWLHRASAPSGSAFVMAGWVRLDTDTAAERAVFGISDGSFFQASRAVIDSGDALVAEQIFSTSGAALGAFTTGVWRWVSLRYDGTTQTLRHLNDGGTAWASNVTQTVGTVTPNELALFAEFASGGTLMAGTCASLKIWSGTLPTDTEVLAERLNTDVTVTAGLWARYAFAEGALGTDGSGNGRTLTLVGTPTFSADRPTDLTIGGGGGGPTVARGTRALLNYYNS